MNILLNLFGLLWWPLKWGGLWLLGIFMVGFIAGAVFGRKYVGKGGE